MKKYTLKTSQVYLKNKEKVELALKEGSILFSVFANKTYSYTVKHPKFKTKLVLKNYTTLTEKAYDYLKKNKLLPVTWEGITVHQEISSASNTIEDVTLDIFSEESQIEINKTNVDYNEGFIDSFLYKIEQKSTKLHIHSTKETEIVPYSKSEITKAIVAYVETLVEQRKINNINNINHSLNVLNNKMERQSLNIVEGEEDQGWKKEYGEAQLSNVFTVCSLEELGVDKKKLKSWVNKVIIKGNITLVTFEKLK